MTDVIRVFVNERAIDVPAGAAAGKAVELLDADLGAAVKQGEAYVTDGRGIRLPAESTLAAGAILRVVRPAGHRPSGEAGKVLTRELISRLPKVELHVHLDGSLRPATMLELAAQQGVRLPADDQDRLYRAMVVADARNLEDYLRRFEITIELLQTAPAIERVAYEMVADAARQNIRYLEVRYCPTLSQRGGLSLEAVTEAELRGLKRGEAEFGVVARVIHCSLRQLSPELSEDIAKHAVEWRDRGVVGFDIAGGEAGRPAGGHARAFEIAAEGGLGITVHAGEAAGAASVAEAVYRCRANRLGHGTRLYEDPALEEYVRDRRILVEINITSNIQTHAVPSAERHPVRHYVDSGLAVSLSSDNWLMSGTNITEETWLAHRALAFTREEIDRMILDGIAAAFLPWPERRTLLERTRAELANIP
jgi:adenosine deaminase